MASARLLPRSAHRLPLLAALALGLHCGSDESPERPKPPFRRVGFEIRLPDCALLSPGDLRITTGMGVYDAGTTSGDVPNVDRPSLVLATRVLGDVEIPVLAGYAYPGEATVTLDTRSTVVASALTHPVLFGTPGAYRVKLARRLESLAGATAAKVEASLCSSAVLPPASPIFRAGLRAEYDELLYEVMSAEGAGTNSEALPLIECGEPSGKTPVGKWCTEGNQLAVSNAKSVFFGLKVSRGGETVVDLVEAKKGFVDVGVDFGKLFTGGEVVTVETERTTRLSAPDLGTWVALEKGFLSSTCNVLHIDDFVSGCLINVGGDARAVGTWSNLGQAFTLAMDVVGVIDKHVDKKLVQQTLQPLASISKRFESFLRPLAEDPCLAFAFQQTLDGVSSILLEMAAAETDEKRRDGLKTAAAFSEASAGAVLELAKLVSGEPSGQAPTQCGTLVNQIAGRLAANQGAIKGRLSQAVGSGDWARIARAIVAEAPRDVLTQLPESLSESALTGLSLYRIGKDLASRDAGLVANDLLLAFYDNPETIGDVAVTIAGAAIDAAIKNIAGFLLSKLVPWVGGPLAVIDVINKGVPFVVDYLTADRASYCYGSSCEPEPDARADGGTDGGADAGGTLVETLATGQDHPSELVVDGANLYWLNFGSYGPGGKWGSLMRMPKTGGVPEALAIDQGKPRNLLTDGSSAYWYTEVRVRSIPLAGGTVSPVWESWSITVKDLALDGSLFFSRTSNNGFELAAYDVGAKQTTVLYASLFTVLGRIATDGGWLYAFVANSAGGTDLARVPVTGGALEVMSSGVPAATAIAGDASHWYWTSDDGSVNRAPKTGGASEQLATGQLSPRGIAVSDTAVYWVNFGSNPATSPGDGSVHRLDKAGGTAALLASDQFWPTSIAVDADRVYFTVYGDGEIRSVAK